MSGERITAADVRGLADSTSASSNCLCRDCAVHRLADRLEAQLAADEREMAALREDAEQYRALQQVIEHPMRSPGGNVVLYRDGTVQTWVLGTSETIRGPLHRLLAKLNSLLPQTCPACGAVKGG